MASALVSVLIGPVSARASAQETQQPFFATAAADGARVRVMLRRFLVVEELADIGGPAAQAQMSDVEGSGYAGYPWPGENFLAAMAIGAGRTGLPVGDYPLVARSSTAGQPESFAERGPVVLSARSGESESVATAEGGFADEAFSAGHTASAAAVRHDPATGAAHAEATNVAEGIRVSDVLSFGAVRSEARVVSVPGGAVEPTSELQVSNAVIAGQAVLVGPDGLRFADTELPVPRDSPLTEALVEHGITLDYVDVTETEDGVIAAGLRVTVVREIPEVPEPAEVVIELGRARAFAQGGSRSAAAVSLDDVVGIGLETGGGFESGPAPEVSPGLEPAFNGAIPGSQTASPAIPSPRVSTGAPLRGARILPALTVNAPLFYPTLVAAGVVLLSSATLLRLLGVRSTWNS